MPYKISLLRVVAESKRRLNGSIRPSCSALYRTLCAADKLSSLTVTQLGDTESSEGLGDLSVSVPENSDMLLKAGFLEAENPSESCVKQCVEDTTAVLEQLSASMKSICKKLSAMDKSTPLVHSSLLDVLNLPTSELVQDRDRRSNKEHLESDFDEDSEAFDKESDYNEQYGDMADEGDCFFSKDETGNQVKSSDDENLDAYISKVRSELGNANESDDDDQISDITSSAGE